MANGGDELIHQPLRLRIMAAVNGLRPNQKIEFAQLKKVVEATDGNLGAHIATLEQAGYVAVEKVFVDKKPRTRISVTPAGRKAFGKHVDYLRDIIESSGAGSL
jgi:DNA-binding MarR family transcriptional regulator